MRLIVNGHEHTVEAPSGPMLLDVLREDLRLTGTKYGCGEGQCGACTVLVDGVPTRACIQPAASVTGPVTTVESLAAEGNLHRVQAAFVNARALQCGYCTPGLVMSAVALLDRNPAPDEVAVRDALAGHICRCGGYPRIMAAVLDAATRPTEVAVEVGAEGGTDGITWTVVVAGRPGVVPGGRGWSTPGGVRLTIDTGGRVTAVTGKVDAGQGNRVALARLIGAELATPTSLVRVEMGDTAATPLDLGTVGSRSMPDAGDALRLAARAAGRELLAAAADRWRVDVAGLTLAGGAVCDAANGQVIGYGALVAAGARTIEVDPDEEVGAAPPGLAAVDDAQLRAHLTAAVTGAKLFPSDLTRPDLLHGRVLRPPAHGAVATTVDTTAAAATADVTIVSDNGFVGVVAPTRAAATRALHSVRADWTVGDQPSDVDLEKYLRDHAVDREGWGGVVERESGDVAAAFAGAEIHLAATYTTAYLAHVPLEPRVAVAEVAADAATVWVGTQRPFAVRDEVAAALGLAPERVRIVVPDFGGGFGGKHTGDVAVEAARLARAVGRPVKVAWSRAEEFRWAYFRPAAVIDVRCAAQADGTLSGWEFTNLNSGSAGLFTPYEVAHRRERYQPADPPLPQGSYRALAATANHFARESHLDELAITVGADPVHLRLRLLRDDRLRAVVGALAEHVGWTGPGRSLGVACGMEKDARVATLAEVAVDADRRLQVLRLVTAVECGTIVDPTGLRNQVIGATVMGLGGALFEGIRFGDGRIHNASLADYRVPRLADVPPIDVVLLDRPDLPSSGGGETPIVAVAPAIANAIRAATGRRLYDLPLVP